MSYQNAGAIYALQLVNGGWVAGDMIITNTKFEECFDCNRDPAHDYVSGVIEASLAKGDGHYGFKMSGGNFLNCQLDERSRITEGQIRLSANLFSLSHSNFSNTNSKIDFSAILFSKYVQEVSTVKFVSAINQYGFTAFEFYDVEGSSVRMSHLAIVNTTFVNSHKGQIIGKVGFINVFFKYENSFFLEDFYVIDFTTIPIDGIDHDLPIVEPVLIVIHDDSKQPITSDIFSNTALGRNNKIPYVMCPSMGYDYESSDFYGMKCFNESYSDTQTADYISEEPQISIEKPTDKYNHIISSTGKDKEKKK